MRVILCFFLVCLVTKLNSQYSCETAIPVSIGNEVYVDFSLSTSPPDQFCLPGPTFATSSIWYSYTPETDLRIRIVSCLNGVTTDNRLHVFSGNCSELVCVGGDDDGGQGFCFEYVFDVYYGSEYFIMVENTWSSENFYFELLSLPPVNPHPLFGSFTPQIQGVLAGVFKHVVSDFNGDFLDDILTLSDGQIQLSYQHPNGGFTVEQIVSPLLEVSELKSVVTADVTQDGYGDIVFADDEKITFLKSVNEGNDYSVIILDNNPPFGKVNLGHVNEDNLLDIIVTKTFAESVAIINDGAGFNSVGINQGIPILAPEAMFIKRMDYDNDGLIDVFYCTNLVSNGGSGQTVLLRNIGNGLFFDATSLSGLDLLGNVFCATWNDFDNDGNIDLIVNCLDSGVSSLRLFKNSGQGHFTEESAISSFGIQNHSITEIASFDFDNNGFLDILFSDWIYYNLGDMKFHKRPFSGGYGSVGDLNNDGFLDVQSENVVYLNTRTSNNWLKLSLKGIQSNFNGVEAFVELYGEWGVQSRRVNSENGNIRANTLNIHFGVGNSSHFDSLIVRWPSGNIDKICSGNVNFRYSIEEGMTFLPTAEFFLNSSQITINETLIVTDVSENCINAWQWSVSPNEGWDYVNNTNSQSQHPRILFFNSGIYEISLQVENENGSSVNSANQYVVVGQTVGIFEDDFENSVVLFPNPSTDKVSIIMTSEGAITNIKLFDAFGQCIIDSIMESSNLNLTNLSSGVYFFYITLASGEKVSKRFIKL